MDWIETAIDVGLRSIQIDHSAYRVAIPVWAVWKAWDHGRKSGFSQVDARSSRDFLDRFIPSPSPPMFPLTERTIGGYAFKQRTWYASQHLGVDYKAATGTPVYAPAPGVVYKQAKGFEGGYTIAFKFDDRDITMRLMHLSSFEGECRHVSQGELIGHTGNTGALTTGAHLHLDLSHGVSVMAGNLSIGNFIDPESFPWDSYDPIHVPVAIEVSAEVSIPVRQTFTVIVANPHRDKNGKPYGESNFRDEPKTSANVFKAYLNGTKVECSEEVHGDKVGSDDVWYKSAHSGKYISRTVSRRL